MHLCLETANNPSIRGVRPTTLTSPRFWRRTNALAFERLYRPGGPMPQALIKERYSPTAKAFLNQHAAGKNH